MSIHKSIRRLGRLSGFEPKRLVRNVGRLPGYVSGYRQLRREARASKEPFQFGTLFPVLDEKSKPAGSANGHYFHQDLFVAQKIFARSPQRHIDVGSRVDGFVAHVASFREIEAIDVRQLTSTTPNIRFLCADLMAELPAELVETTDSLSCLHAIEDFGLGRYGDPMDFEGHLRGLRNLRRMLKTGGRLYLSTPISNQQRIEFNAHRVFSLPYLRSLLKDDFDIDTFSYVGDDGNLHPHVEPDTLDFEQSYNLCYGCGIFELTAKAA